MATLFRSKKSGLTRIQFDGPDGKRRTISLGRCPLKIAERLQPRIEALAAVARYGGTLDDETARWLPTVTDALHGKLAAAGLVPARSAATLKAFIDDYIRELPAKESTKATYRRARRLLVECFGADKPLRDLTPGDAKDFRRFVAAQPGHGAKDADGKRPPMAESTVRKMCNRAKTIFADARDRRMIDRNPFEHRDVPTTDCSNPRRQRFVTRDETAKAIAAAPDAEWRLIIALSRYGGLRCPSETLALTWEDVDWSGGRFVVHASKTAHHDAKGVRVVPLFPELRPHLEAVYDLAPDGTRHVIARRRNANHRTMMQKIIKRAGLQPWPRLFHNLRASRQTELENEFPTHVVCAWLGNSPAVARKHYLQVTDEHFSQAVGSCSARHGENGTRIPVEGALHELAAGGTQGFAGNRRPRKKPHAAATAAHGIASDGPCWTRTSDLSDVNRAL